jgi:hypothetical protein
MLLLWRALVGEGWLDWVRLDWLMTPALAARSPLAWFLCWMLCSRSGLAMLLLWRALLMVGVGWLDWVRLTPALAAGSATCFGV